jgi:hypothetical protein
MRGAVRRVQLAWVVINAKSIFMSRPGRQEHAYRTATGALIYQIGLTIIVPLLPARES